MLKTRLIPVLLLKNGLLVRSEYFNVHQIIGNPINEVDRFNQWNVDELIYIDISEGKNYDLGTFLLIYVQPATLFFSMSILFKGQ